MKIKFHYQVSWEVVVEEFIKGNETQCIDRIVAFDSSELSAKARKNLYSLSYSGEMIDNDPPLEQFLSFNEDDEQPEDIDVRLGHFLVVSRTSARPEMLFIPDDLEKAPLSLQDIEVWLEKMFQSKEETYELHCQAEQQYRIAQREREKAQSIEKARIEKYKDRERSQMRRWAKAYGSERLRLGLELGYDCDRLYVKERANIEYPGFIVDLDGKGDYYYQVDPSLEALKIVKALIKKGKSAEVVCLLTDLEDKYEDEFELCEAVKVDNFLGGYDLYKLME